jgi:hypothetical protein
MRFSLSLSPSLPARLVAMVAVAAFAVACATDGPAAPALDAGHTGPARAVLSNTSVKVTTLQRATPLASPISVSKTIGPLGGVIAIPAAGLSVTFPPLAVAKATTITVTALAGRAVAYEFEPHGLKFTAPLIAMQDLTKTNTTGLDLSLLSAGYFEDANDINTVTGTAKVSELFNVNATLSPLSAVWTIPHFSGYLVATGRSGE